MGIQGCLLSCSRLFFPEFFKNFSVILSPQSINQFFSTTITQFHISLNLYLPSSPYVSNVSDTVWGSACPSTCSVLQFVPGESLWSYIVPPHQGWLVLHRALMMGIVTAHQPANDSTQTLMLSLLPAALGLGSWRSSLVRDSFFMWFTEGLLLRKSLWR